MTQRNVLFTAAGIVVILVILSSIYIVYVFTLELGDGGPSGPNTSFASDFNNSTQTLTIIHAGGQNLTYKKGDGNQRTAKLWVQVNSRQGNWRIIWVNEDHEGRGEYPVTEGDSISIKNLNYGDTVELRWVSGNGLERVLFKEDIEPKNS
jgi:hypothetical protein